MKKYSFNDNIQEFEIDPEFIKEGVKQAEKKGYSSIRIISLNDNKGKTYNLDLTPMENKSFIKLVSISDNFRVGKFNIDALYTLSNLTQLFCENKSIIFDYALLPRLEHIYYDYSHKSLNFTSLIALKSIVIRGFSEMDCTILSGFKRLESLYLSGGNIESLNGIENLQNLLVINLSYCAKLSDIKPVLTLQKLHTLHVEKCKRVNDIVVTDDNHSLENVFVSELESLLFIEKLKNLKKLKFWDLKDGNILPVLEKSPPLEEVDFFPNKKHYSHKKEQIEAILNKMNP
ncbi:leucine-rich repeat domain-containing protein [Cohnella terricola]|uniref:Leucine-rich repeat domain-containing protein n=1 Tax=Cohnella terricola TaxID=1289167 RepID=A0A559JQC5_9BACL|nr:leucine-rich repeat domain-containing protein [Cohnella terricola]TVY02057.1 leucine-rich repeat domain-containing protein [Cohnella terricola]